MRHRGKYIYFVIFFLRYISLFRKGIALFRDNNFLFHENDIIFFLYYTSLFLNLFFSITRLYFRTHLYYKEEIVSCKYYVRQWFASAISGNSVTSYRQYKLAGSHDIMNVPAMYN